MAPPTPQFHTIDIEGVGAVPFEVGTPDDVIAQVSRQLQVEASIQKQPSSKPSQAKDLPSLFDIPVESGVFSPGERVRFLTGLLVTPDDRAVADIVAKMRPGATTRVDDDGQAIVRFPTEGTDPSIAGKEFTVQRPGFDQSDILRFIAQAALAARGGVSKSPRMLGRVAGTFGRQAGVSTGLDIVAGQLGSEQGISGERAALSGVLGAGTQTITQPAKRFLLRVFNKGKFFDKATGQLTARGVLEAEKAGVDPAGVTAAFSENFARELSEAGFGSKSAELFDAVRRATGLMDIAASGTRALTGTFESPATVAAQRRAVLDATRQAQREAAATIGLGRQLDIPVTAGEVSGDINQRALEESVRRGQLGGDKSIKDITVFEGFRRQRIEEARQRIQAQAGGTSSPQFDTPATGAPKVITALKEAEAAAKLAVDDAYRVAGLSPATFTGSDIKPLLQGVSTFLKGEGYRSGLKGFGGTKNAVSSLRRFNKVVKKQAANPSSFTTFQQFEMTRRQLGLAFKSANNDADRGLVGAIKDQFDDYLRTVTNRGLFTGDPAFLNLMRTARSATTDLKKRFTDRDKDAVGKTVVQILKTGPAAPENALNLVFGMNKLGAKQTAVGVVKRLKEALGGADTEGFKALSEIAALRLTQPQGYGSKILAQSKSIDNFFRDSPSLANEIFTAETQALLKNFSFLAKRGEVTEDVLRKITSDEGLTFGKLARAFIRRGGTMATFRGHPAAGAGLFLLARTPVVRTSLVKKSLKEPRAIQTTPVITGAGATEGRREGEFPEFPDVQVPAAISNAFGFGGR